MKERLDQARGMIGDSVASSRTDAAPFHLAQKAATSSTLSFGRIAKPLRGGGGSAAASAAIASASPPLAGTNANPLARLQNEESG